ncbi:arylamine N-acetyltransferase [Bacillus spongiae]|uniref:Arylamine N-acetyltransferase n=1 Tax=Bacillus spongiae TaxID=2683610 RepID=A0ABU8HBS1_9BACI
MDIKTYLERINVEALSGDPLKDLQLLIKQHIMTVPFENLDVLHKVPITLNLERIYQKIVENHRGGFCYEVNGLFHWLLSSLGYDVKRIASTVAKSETEWYRKNTHLSNIVTIDGKEYVVDVGFGDSSYSPIPLDGEVVKDVGGNYRIKRVDDTYYDLQKYDEQKWKVKYRFTKKVRSYSFFEEVCQWNQQSPESSFTQKTIVTLGTLKGRVTLTDDEVITTVNGQKTKRPYDQNELPKILKDSFGISIPK